MITCNGASKVIRNFLLDTQSVLRKDKTRLQDDSGIR